MDVQTLTFIIVGASFAMYIAIAIWARAGSTKEFYVAGGGVPPVANGMATAADWMSAASFISMAGIISFVGYDGGVYLMGWTGGYVLLALCLAPYLRKFGKFTVPDFIGDRYYSQTARTVAVICAIFICFTYIAGQMRGVGVVFSRFLEVDIETGIVFVESGLTVGNVGGSARMNFNVVGDAMFIQPSKELHAALTTNQGSQEYYEAWGLVFGTMQSLGFEFDNPDWNHAVVRQGVYTPPVVIHLDNY